MIQKRAQASNHPNISTRSRIALGTIYLVLLLIVSRLFYWQVIQAETLSEQAEQQYSRSVTLTGNRGSILTSDGYTLVTNEQVFTLFAQPHILQDKPDDIVASITPLLLDELEEYQNATESSQREAIEEEFRNQLTNKLSKESKWVSLKVNISEETKNKIEELSIYGLGFDQNLKRFYPEASMAAHITGFVGKDDSGQDIGYFGVEGALEQELKARTSKNKVITDALGLQLSGKNSMEESLVDGRSITLTIRRDIQNIVEEELQAAVEFYGAESGEVIVMDPSTGEILALAAYPNYEQSKFYEYDSQYHKNPTLSNLYEPGSTFKAITVAAGIEEGVISPDTQCTFCAGPRQYGKYTIRTWNNEYTPNITIEEGLAKSDNIAMIFIAEKLGVQKFQDYLHRFKIGERIHIDLQEDHDTPYPGNWGDVKLATTSFGQGIVANSMQVIRAIGAIANDGIMMRPTIVASVKNTTTGEEIFHQPVEEGRVISKETSEVVTKMLVTSAQHGEAQWTASEKYVIAGKTGTSQVVTEQGYDDEKTIASFVGFAPPEDPKFIMITKLNAPARSPWASETAAPLWHKIAKKLYLLLGVMPQKVSQNSELMIW